MVEMKVQLSCQWQFLSGKLFRSLIPFLYMGLFRLNFWSHFLSRAKPFSTGWRFYHRNPKNIWFQGKEFLCYLFRADKYKIYKRHYSKTENIFNYQTSLTSFMASMKWQMLLAEIDEMWQWQIHFILSQTNFAF